MIRNRHLHLIAVAIVLVPFLAGCGGGQFVARNALEAKSTETSKSVRDPQPNLPNLFAHAVGKSLSLSDLDQYIDASVQGPDRERLRHLMAMLPSNMRGDVVYFDGVRAISNNPAVLPYLKSVPPTTMDKQQPGYVQRATSAQRRHFTMVGSCSPPDPYPGSGPYVREVGNCGFTSGWGIVNLECNSSSFKSNVDTFPNYQDNKEGGYMYYELTNAYNHPNTLSEGGIFTQYDIANEYDIDPYITSNLGTLQNNGARFTCGTYIGVMSGLVLTTNLNQPYYYVATGTIPGYNPANAWQSTETVTMSNAAWIFEPAPGTGYTWGLNSVGLQSPCMQCSVSKVTSIADQGGSDIWDNSYFGVDQTFGTNAVYWPEIVFGVWNDCVSGGSSPPTGCTLKYSPDATKWYAGQENYPQPLGQAWPDAQSSFVANGNWVYQSYDSVTAAPPAIGPASMYRGGNFPAPTPGPLCTADSDGLCAVNTAPSMNYTTCYIWTYSVQGKIWYWKATSLPTKSEYAIYRLTSLQGLAEKTVTLKQYGCDPTSTAWTPAEPSVTYNDPNLP